MNYLQTISTAIGIPFLSRLLEWGGEGGRGEVPILKDEALNKWGAHLIYFQIVVRYARFLFFLLLVIEIPSLKNNTNCVLTCNTRTKQFLKFSLRHRRFF